MDGEVAKERGRVVGLVKYLQSQREGRRTTLRAKRGKEGGVWKLAASGRKAVERKSAYPRPSPRLRHEAAALRPTPGLARARTRGCATIETSGARQSELPKMLEIERIARKCLRRKAKGFAESQNLLLSRGSRRI